VQSAVARHVLTQMLLQLGVVVDPATSNIEPVFNDSESHPVGADVSLGEQRRHD
jgi:uncharacterized membrane protein